MAKGCDTSWTLPNAVMFTVLAALLILNTPTNGLQPPSSPDTVTRRDLLHSLATTAAATATVGPLVTPQPAHAARGAAELDFEYYMRDLMGGNKKEGNVLPSTPPPVAAPRTLKGPLLPLLLNNDCSPSCIPVQALMDTVQQSSKGSSTASAIAQDIQERVTAIKEKTAKSFNAKSPWQKEDVSDQYYFDFTCYALWKAAAALLPNNLDRDQFARLVGKGLVAKLLQDEGLLSKPKGGSTNIVDSIPAVQELLQLFQSSGYAKSFRIRTSDNVDNHNSSSSSSRNNAIPIFDELDDESLQIGGSVDCLVSIIEPASLGASLQINGEQSRFGPDFIGTSLAAIWESYGIKSTWEVFFVDAEYRPNPKDYFPNEQLLQFTLTMKK